VRPGAALSHRSAAALWALRSGAGPSIDVAVPSNGGRQRRRGIRVHRSRRMPREEVTTEIGIPVTTVARTLLDLADVLQPHELKRAVAEADYRGVFDLTALIAVVRANPGRRGATVMRAVSARPLRTRSDLEDRFLDLIERHGLPRPSAGMVIAAHEADFAWPDAGLIVETDGGAAHRTDEAFEADRLRDRATLRAGYRTIRLTKTALADEAAVVRDLALELRTTD
jgi:very-short-patch-repair endonuclease